MSEAFRKNISQGIKVTVVGMAANLLLVILKMYAGMLSKSQALIADGIHSLSDLLSDVIVILGLKWGSKEADEDHPYGHGRIETLSSMIVGLMLILFGIGLTYNAMTSLYSHDISHPGPLALIAAAISIIVKEGLYWYTVKTGRKMKSLAVIGNAWHHRSDALSSVAVLIGVGATYLDPSLVYADALAALVVTYFVVKVGASLLWQAMKEVVDTAPSEKTVQKIHDLALAVDGVKNVHDIRARFSASQILSELHIVVDPDQSVREGHAVAKAVEKVLIDEIEDLVKVTIHVDPEKPTVTENSQ